MRNNHRVSVVIPAFDEEAAVGRVIADIPQWIDGIIVADNGSRDRTADVARAAGARVVSIPERGYGAACLAGVAALNATDIVVFIDADYSDDPSEMAGLVDPIAAGAADLVIGSRTLGHASRGALGPHQRFGNGLACFLIKRIWGVAYSDLGPFRAIRRTALDALAMRDRAYGWTVEMQIKAAQRGLRVRDVPVSYRQRIGRSKISGTVKGSVMAGATILAVIFRSALNRPGNNNRREPW